MFDSKKAADYLVVAWCKEWPLWQYLNAIMERQLGEGDLTQAVNEASAAFPWLTTQVHAYKRNTREFVAGAYPKLNTWLWDRPDDISRLKCSSQIERLRCPDFLRGYVSANDRSELKQSKRVLRQATTSYRASRDAFKTHQRSAWNVCK